MPRVIQDLDFLSKDALEMKETLEGIKREIEAATLKADKSVLSLREIDQIKERMEERSISLLFPLIFFQDCALFAVDHFGYIQFIFCFCCCFKARKHWKKLRIGRAFQPRWKRS